MPTSKKPKIQIIYESANTFFMALKESSNYSSKSHKKKLHTMFDELYDILKTLTPDDVGIKDRGSYSKHFILIPIYECELFVMWLFFVPKGETLPFHDHPGHTVLSKFLYGKVHLQSAEMIPDCKSDSLECKITSDSVITLSSGHLEVIGDKFPVNEYSKGNLHKLTALEPMAFLDITSPPINVEIPGYAKVKYYKWKLGKNGKVSLEEDLGEGPQFYTADYIGPKIQEVKQ